MRFICFLTALILSAGVYGQEWHFVRTTAANHADAQYFVACATNWVNVRGETRTVVSSMAENGEIEPATVPEIAVPWSDREGIDGYIARQRFNLWIEAIEFVDSRGRELTPRNLYYDDGLSREAERQFHNYAEIAVDVRTETSFDVFGGDQMFAFEFDRFGATRIDNPMDTTGNIYVVTLRVY